MFFNLFSHLDGQRRAVAQAEAGLEVRGTSIRLTPREAVARLEADPTLWSAGVLLRPLGNVVYALPPACVDDAQIAQIATAMRALVAAVD